MRAEEAQRGRREEEDGQVRRRRERRDDQEGRDRRDCLTHSLGLYVHVLHTQNFFFCNDLNSVKFSIVAFTGKNEQT